MHGPKYEAMQDLICRVVLDKELVLRPTHAKSFAGYLMERLVKSGAVAAVAAETEGK